MKENNNNNDELLNNIFSLCVKIKLIFVKSILKSLLLENYEKNENFFHFHYIYNFKDLYCLFSDQEFFSSYILENLLHDINVKEDIFESIPCSMMDNIKINLFIIFLFNIYIGFFINKVEKIRDGLNEFYSNENKDLKVENLIIKDFYSLNNYMDQMSKKNLIIISNILRKINQLFLSDENSNFKQIESSDINQGK